MPNIFSFRVLAELLFYPLGWWDDLDFPIRKDIQQPCLDDDGIIRDTASIRKDKI